MGKKRTCSREEDTAPRGSYHARPGHSSTDEEEEEEEGEEEEGKGCVCNGGYYLGKEEKQVLKENNTTR
ncbi:hypothetical protein VZT92_012002 [Zoarces viviparus]|uniref:Uncharacterized protein n=1 Tax=Zoarces viviparus TaxID=48416 RepID=A0AAW1F7B8_ZOAVI